MSAFSREAGPTEVAGVWPVLRGAGAFRDAEEFERYRETVPWAVRANDRGEACVVSPWRARRPILAIRALVCAESRVRPWVDELSGLGVVHGFDSLLSPLVPYEWLAPYVASGMRPVVRLVALRASPMHVVRTTPPRRVELRAACASDTDGILTVDEACFDALWRFGRAEIEQMMVAGRLVVAEMEGEVIGYTHSTVVGRVHTLGRLAVAPAWRRQGVGAALIADAAEHASRSGGGELSLCTQEENTASRALYREAGFEEVPGRYGLAMLGTSVEGRSEC